MAEDLSGQGLVTGVTGGSTTSNFAVSFTRGSIKYDSPFLDMTSTFLPKTIKSLIAFIASFVLGDGVVSQCVNKLSEYPITDIIYGDEDKPANLDKDKTTDKWKRLFEKHLKITRVMKQAGMDYHAYGNSVMSIHFPFKRLLECPRCKTQHTAEGLNAAFKDFKFHAKCINKGCDYNGAMDAKDVPSQELSRTSIISWDIMFLDIKYNSITGEHFYYYTIPPDIVAAVRSGDMDIISSLRLEVIDAVRRRKQLKLMVDNVFHLKRPGPQYLIPAQRGWGIPAIMPVLKDIFHIKVLKKGNEMIAFDHIVPLRILFPIASGDVSPHAVMNLGNWRTKIETEIRKWRADPNYVSIVPLPLGMQNFSGDAKLLMLTQEIKLIEDDVITGIGMIPEIIRGGASWSGSNVSLRVVENTFLNHRTSMIEFMDWVKEKCSSYFDMPTIDIKMADFKMADDLQKKQMMMQDAMGDPSTSLGSRTTMQKELGLDPEKEHKLKENELKRMIEMKVKAAEGEAEAAGSAMVINAMFAADAELSNRSKAEQNDREYQATREQMSQEGKMVNAEGVAVEAQGLEAKKGYQPGTISIPNLIMIVTSRFARLAELDPNEFKIRMLAMKNSTPSLYQEVYGNLKEMNVILADTMPDLETIQKYTPGQIPSASQGDIYGEQQPGPAEAGADTGIVAEPEQRPLSTQPPLPEQRPPRSPSAGI